MENFFTPANFPIMVSFALVALLMVKPSFGLTRAAVLAALLTLACDTAGMPSLFGETAQHLFVVLIVMSATSLPVLVLMDDGLGEDLSAALVRLCSHRVLSRVPSSVVLPCIMLPAAMLGAMALHNIPAILILTPLAIALAARFGVPVMPTLCGMLIASNLGGASFAAGDTPAILQRMAFGFDVSTFSIAMVPRNLVVLATLLGFTAGLSWLLTTKRGGPSPIELYDRRVARDYYLSESRSVGGSRARPWAIGALVALIGSQFISTNATLVVSLLILALVLSCARDFLRAAYVLGTETWLAISGLFILATAVQHTPFVQSAVAGMLTAPGGIELTAYAVTSMISADGAAGLLTKLVYTHANGAFSAAWALACGICAGSSALLSSASAGPIMIEVARREGVEVTFRSYAKFGLPFSAVMIGIYLLINQVMGG